MSAGLVSGRHVDLVWRGDKQPGFPYRLIVNIPLPNTEIADKVGVSEVPADWDAHIAALEEFKAAEVVVPQAAREGLAGWNPGTNWIKLGR